MIFTSNKKRPYNDLFLFLNLSLVFFFWLFTPFKFDNPYPRVCTPTIPVKVRFFDGAIPNINKSGFISCAIWYRMQARASRTLFPRSLWRDFLQPLNSHIRNLKPDTCSFFWHVDGWVPYMTIIFKVAFCYFVRSKNILFI